MLRSSFRPHNENKNPRRWAGGYRDYAAAGSTGHLAVSGHFEIFRRCPAAIGHEFEFDILAFVERAEASALHRRDVDEDVLVAGRRPDEPVAFSGIEPFDGALLHRLSPEQV